MKVKIQTSATEIKIYEIDAQNEKEAWAKGSKIGVVIGFGHDATGVYFSKP